MGPVRISLWQRIAVRGATASVAKEGGDGWVSEKSLEMRRFQALAHLQESLGMEKMRQTAPKDAVGRIIDTGPG